MSFVHLRSLNIVNEGRVAIGDLTGLIPCTPNGVVQLIKRYTFYLPAKLNKVFISYANNFICMYNFRSGIEISGRNAVVLGRSKIVGAPVASLLLWHNATVTICHSKTKNIEKEVRQKYLEIVL